jgi:hypothetical protein
MSYSVYPAPVASSGKIFKRESLTSGTSWSVPTGVTNVNVTLVGGGGGGSVGATDTGRGQQGQGGQITHSTLTVTPGSSISYSIGTGGAGGTSDAGGSGGTTTFTGATSALGGLGGNRYDGVASRNGITANNGGTGGGRDTTRSGGAGGTGAVIIEYWV